MWGKSNGWIIGWGSILTCLVSRKFRNDTIICITSDHGEMSFDRGIHRKESRPRSSVFSIPLICYGTGIVRNEFKDMAVSTIDLVPTILDFAGLLSKTPAGMSTSSLKPLMDGQSMFTLV